MREAWFAAENNLAKHIFDQVLANEHVALLPELKQQAMDLEMPEVMGFARLFYGNAKGDAANI